MEENFWSNTHFNMFSIYASLTKGQRPSFRNFLSGGSKANSISDKFLCDQLKCVHLYHCFIEAGDHTMCSIIEQADIFCSKSIIPQSNGLTPSDMECISLFLASSLNKKWVALDLGGCYIQDKGINILYRGLCHGNEVTIKHIWFYSNGLTAQSFSLISDITMKCKVKDLRINGNYNIVESQQLYSLLTNPCNVLEQLNLDNTKLSSRAAINLFKALKINSKLTELYINYNDITDDALDAIIAALGDQNSCLVTLHMWSNPLSSEAILKIVSCLEANNTLLLLRLPDYPENIQENIRSLQNIINKKRESRGYEMKIEIKCGLF